jgi:hypothetical protein
MQREHAIGPQFHRWCPKTSSLMLLGTGALGLLGSIRKLLR